MLMTNITCFDVADFFLNRAAKEEDGGEIISNLKLQKLVYYAQGFHLAMFEAPFFNESLEAWTHGPVIPDLYHDKKQFGDNGIPFNPEFDASIFTQKQRDLLNEIYEVFGQFSAWKLRELTHQESPWLKNKKHKGLIPQADLIEYFKTQLN
jgi:uncharacterized phage-associated protein